MSIQKPCTRGDRIGLPADRLLSRLKKVKAVGQGKWQACCPAHDDRNPSLSIKELPNGTLLVKCWSGCSTQEIVQSVDLKLMDLFPITQDQPRPLRKLYTPSKEAIEIERLVVAIGLDHIAHGVPITPQDQARFELAKQRLQALRKLEVKHGR